MTDEKLAKERATKFADINYNEPDNYGTEKEIGYDAYYAGFLAGLEAGRPKWHKVADGDLPTEEKEYIVKLTDGTVDIMAIALDGNLEPYVPSISIDFYRDVEKWCEIPKFEEE